jgi:hypothetical protein
MDRINAHNLHELLFNREPDFDMEQLDALSTKQLDSLIHQAPIANDDDETFKLSAAVLACNLMLAKTIASAASHNFGMKFEDACADIVQRVDHLLYEWCQAHNGGN